MSAPAIEQFEVRNRWTDRATFKAWRLHEDGEASPRDATGEGLGLGLGEPCERESNAIYVARRALPALGVFFAMWLIVAALFAIGG